MINLPQILYKYRDWNDSFHKKILTENEIYLPSPNQFNDPFDASLAYKLKNEDLTEAKLIKKSIEIRNQLNQNISDEEIKRNIKERISLGKFENNEYRNDYVEKFVKEVNELYGIFSTTPKHDNLLMWAHYANSHKGFCIGFNTYELLKVLECRIEKINYCIELPEVSLFENSQNSLNEVLITKSIDWQYEEEYRFIKVPGARINFIISNKIISEIILGQNMLINHRNEIIELAIKKFPKLKIYQSEMNLENFKLDIKPLN